MLLSQLTKKLLTLTNNLTGIKSIKISKNMSPCDTTIEHPALLADGSLNTKYKLNRALDEVNNSIQKEGPTNHHLIRKANILLKKGKIRKAKAILTDLSQVKNDVESSSTAKQLLASLPQIQQEDSKKKIQTLIRELHGLPKNFHNMPTHLPEAEILQRNLDIAQLVRKESRRARTKGLPKLACNLIDQALRAGYQSPWLLHEKALCLNMIGQKKQALNILKELSRTNKGEKITSSINKSTEDIKKETHHSKHQMNIFLAKQSIIMANCNSLRINFIPPISRIKANTNIKQLVFKEARTAIKKNPRASLDLTNTILDYFENDLAALQLKGEALSELNREDEAIQIWKNLIQCKNKDITSKASKLIAYSIAKKIKSNQKNYSPKSAIEFYIQQQLEIGLDPIITNEAKEILRQFTAPGTEFSDPELSKHHLQLQFNTLVIECLEARWRKRERLDSSLPDQKPGAIRKTG